MFLVHFIRCFQITRFVASRDSHASLSLSLPVHLFSTNDIFSDSYYPFYAPLFFHPQAAAHAADQKARALMALVRISSASSSSLLGADANKASPSISRANSRDELLPPLRPLLTAVSEAPFGAKAATPLRSEPSASVAASAASSSALV